jgi:hypothetical protein
MEQRSHRSPHRLNWDIGDTVSLIGPSLYWLLVLLVALGTVSGSPGFGDGWNTVRAVLPPDRGVWSPQAFSIGPIAPALQSPLPSLDWSDYAPPFPGHVTTDRVGLTPVWTAGRGISLPALALRPHEAPRGELSPFGVRVLPGLLLGLFLAVGLRWARPLRAPPTRPCAVCPN